MTFEMLKVNAVRRRDFRRAGYVCIEQLCEHRLCTAGLVYRFSELHEFFVKEGKLPEVIEHESMTSLADAVNELYDSNSSVLIVVEARFPPRTPKAIRRNYLLYGLWAEREFAEDIAQELKQLEHSTDN